VSLPAGLESVVGAQQLYDWFSYWPDFHDAEVIKFRLDPAASSSLVVHTWQMTNRVNAQGHYEQTRNAVVTFELKGLSKLDLVDVWEGSIFLEVGLEKVETGFRLAFSSAYGFSGILEVEELSISIIPGQPGGNV
jgi:hypothetical protein